MKSRNPKLQGNIAKYFIYELSQRRNIFPLIAIFFLTLPNTTAKEIGLFVGIGFLAEVFLEIPSSYFADRIGHKETMLLSKLFMIASSLCFAFATGFWYFAFGSAFMSFAIAFSGGVSATFMHDTMRELGRERDYTKIMSRIQGFASLLSVPIILCLPFLTLYSIRLPFQIWLVVDCIGLLVTLLLIAPPREQDTAPASLRAVWSIMKRGVKPGFYLFSFFAGAIGGFLVADGAYRYVYLQSLGYPVIFIGAVMALSRFVWFILGNHIHLVERFPMRRVLLFDLFLFPLAYVLIATFSNPYIVGGFFSIVIGYFWARKQIYTSYSLRSFIKNKRYRATILSITNQIEDVFQMIVAFAIAFVMAYSYKLGFFILGITLFVLLGALYLALAPKLKVSSRNQVRSR